MPPIVAHDSIASVTHAEEKPRDMLLHACCGPCSLEPVRVLRERGCEPDVFYANSNIAPAGEYDRRLDAIRQWAAETGLSFTEGSYRPQAWDERVGKPWQEGALTREERCRACYRLRFEETASYAAAHGYASMGTTLSVSPYQYTDVIRQELEHACATVGIQAAFEDWRPFYDEATRRSRAAGMYRQNYCGCVFSKAEAEAERAERKAARAAERERRAAERADELEQQAREREARRAERAAYDEKRARQRRILKELRGRGASGDVRF